jgi:hypothetical protein
LIGAVSQVFAENSEFKGMPPGASMAIQSEQSPSSNDNVLLLASNQDRDQEHDRDRDRDRDKHKHKPNCGQFNKQACHSHYPDCCWASSHSQSGNCVSCR